MAEAAERLTEELEARPAGQPPDATQILLDDARVRVDLLRYLLD